MKPKLRNKQKDILFILISSFVVVVAWIGFNLYHIWATSSVSQDVQAQLSPISPEFDPQVLQELRSRENVNPLFESQSNPVATSPATIQQNTPTASPLPQTTQSPSPTTSNTTQITPSGSTINRSGQ